MIRVYLVRHGETDWNRDGICMGQQDIPLNDLGRRQAELTAERLAQTELAAIYSSDLLRALETAQIIAQPHHLGPIERRAWREADYGLWEGRKREEIERLFPESREIDWQREDSLSFQPPGGESRRALYERATHEFEAICAQHPDQSVLIATHGGVIRAIVNYVFNRQADPLAAPFYTRGFACSNCGITLIETNPTRGLRISYLNDTYHLSVLQPMSHPYPR
jgi:broad specificity phosphatase PhoE